MMYLYKEKIADNLRDIHNTTGRQYDKFSWHRPIYDEDLRLREEGVFSKLITTIFQGLTADETL